MGAVISMDQKYRYRLDRVWDEGKGHSVFIMLNPSTADAELDDPTIRRCKGFARAWGYGGLIVVNLFAYRETDPRYLAAVGDPIGPENDQHIIAAVTHPRTALVVAAWGNRGSLYGRSQWVRHLIESRGVTVCVLRFTSKGEPWHPLYLPASITPSAWRNLEHEEVLA